MPISQGGAGGLPGMNLKAWVLMTTAGVIVKSSNVTSITKGGTGIYTVNFTSAMGGVEYLAKYTAGPVGSVAPIGGNAMARTVNAAQVGVSLGGGAFDIGGLWEFYE